MLPKISHSGLPHKKSVHAYPFLFLRFKIWLLISISYLTLFNSHSTYANNNWTSNYAVNEFTLRGEKMNIAVKLHPVNWKARSSSAPDVNTFVVNSWWVWDAKTAPSSYTGVTTNWTSDGRVRRKIMRAT